MKTRMYYHIYVKDISCNVWDEPIEPAEVAKGPELVTKLEYYKKNSKAIKYVHTPTSRYRTTLFRFELV